MNYIAMERSAREGAIIIMLWVSEQLNARAPREKDHRKNFRVSPIIFMMMASASSYKSRTE
jgi:hypothetical protein